MNISAKFQLYTPYSFSGVDFLIFFTNLASCYDNQSIDRFGQKVNVWKRTTQQTFLKNFCQNICNGIAINANFHFSHYKSMEI